MTSESAKAAEPKAILGAARKAELSYYLDKSVYTSSYPDLGISTPTSCTNTHYFRYDIALDAGSERVRSLRCTTGGKSPNASRAYWVILRLNGTHYSIWEDGSGNTGFW